MILTTCAACAAPLAHDHKARCIRCKTRYCDATCQHDHWRRGHKQICKKIHRGGNAEQYNADKKYKEAVAVAVEACAADTKGQKCYICLEAVHPRTGEGLVRGCACGDRDGVASGSTGVAHVSCLSEQAWNMFEGILSGGVSGDKLKMFSHGWTMWYRCGLCGQDYHGVVRCALGWACYKTNVSHPGFQVCQTQVKVSEILGIGLRQAGMVEEALAVFEAGSSALRRGKGTIEPDPFARHALSMKEHIAKCYDLLGRHEEAVRIHQEVCATKEQRFGKTDKSTIVSSMNLVYSLGFAGQKAAAREYACELLDTMQEVLGHEHHLFIKLLSNYGLLVAQDPSCEFEEIWAAREPLDDIKPVAMRVFGASHPIVRSLDSSSKTINMWLARVRSSILFDGDPRFHPSHRGYDPFDAARETRRAAAGEFLSSDTRTQT